MCVIVAGDTVSKLPLLKSPTEATKKPAATPAGGDVTGPRKPAAAKVRSAPGSRPRSNAGDVVAGGGDGGYGGPESSSRKPEVDVEALKASFLDESHPEAILTLIEQAKIKREREAEKSRLAATQATVRETLLKQVRGVWGARRVEQRLALGGVVGNRQCPTPLVTVRLFLLFFTPLPLSTRLPRLVCSKRRRG